MVNARDFTKYRAVVTAKNNTWDQLVNRYFIIIEVNQKGSVYFWLTKLVKQNTHEESVIYLFILNSDYHKTGEI